MFKDKHIISEIDGFLKAPDLITKLSKVKAVKYSKRLNCYYAHINGKYAGKEVRLFFCKRGKKGSWNAFLFTNIKLDFFEAYRIYAMWWAIEVCSG